MSERRIRVAIADDSPFARRAFSRLLATEAQVEVVGEAEDGEQALALCRAQRPEVLLLDLQMPVLDGLAVLERLRAEAPEVATVVVSASAQRGAQATLSALEAGAFDFVDKASVSSMEVHALGPELLAKVRAAAQSRRRRRQASEAPPRGAFALPEVLVLGASTGGPLALLHLLARLPADFPAPVVVIQHIPASFVAPLAERLAQSAAMEVRVAIARDELAPGTITFLGGGRDLEVVRREGGLGLVTRSPRPAAPHVPAIDTLFHSAASACGPRTWGVLLTGMGDDGARGLLAIREAGGLTLVQDEATSAVWGMPRAAFELGAAFAALPLHEITRYLCEALGGMSHVEPTGA